MRASMLDKVIAAKRAELGLGAGAPDGLPAGRSRLRTLSRGRSPSMALSC